jgi:Transposase DDE domain
MQVAVLTNLPIADADAFTVADPYLERWQIENMFQTITDTFHCELNRLPRTRSLRQHMLSLFPQGILPQSLQFISVDSRDHALFQ